MLKRIFSAAIVLACSSSVVAADKDLLLETFGYNKATIYDPATGERAKVIISPEGRPDDCPPDVWWSDSMQVVNCGSGQVYKAKYKDFIEFGKKDDVPLKPVDGTDRPGPMKKSDPNIDVPSDGN